MAEKKPDKTVLPSELGGPPSPSVRQQIGPYRLLQKVGEGGMGEVYEAEQTEPVRRRVALKVIKHGMDTKEVVARFEAERQALAMMDHPSVAKVFDAGATPNGRPYFVMEFVQGVPITEYCDSNKLSNRDRLELFMQVCEGVQHAHQKAIIHRDLKPSNVLVAIQDDKAVPKIIDFGVAKATTQKLTERTMFTQLGVLIGTPEYMSPEQAEMSGANVDTRTDVYSLGVMLYELLTGELPFDAKELRSAGINGIREKIRENEPLRPSTRLSRLAKGDESARRRRADIATLQRQLQGDLDWITMKSLEKDRSRRYASPSEMAADIGRHLAHQPVVAGPPSAAYRAGKFVRRHRLGVGVAVSAVLVLIAFAMTMFVQARRIEREAQTAERVSEFLVGLFEISSPSKSRGESITARELLDEGVLQIEAGLEDQPELRARMMNTMGDVYRRLGLYQKARPLLEAAVEIQSELLGRSHRDTLQSTNNLAIVYRRVGRYDDAERLYDETVAQRRRVLGADDPRTLNSIQGLAQVYTAQGRYDAAEPLYRDTLETCRRVFGNDDPKTLTIVNNLANWYAYQDRHTEAEPLYLEAFETRSRDLGDDHPDTLKSATNLANWYAGQGRYADAESLYVTTLETKKRVLGDDHSSTLATENSLAELYRKQGQYDKAEPLYRDVLEAQERIFQGEHFEIAVTVHNMACLHRDTGRHDEARRGFERVQAFCDEQLRPEHGFTIANLTEHARLLRLTGEDGRAEQFEARARAAREP